MTEIKIRVKHRDTEVEVSVPVQEAHDSQADKHFSLLIQKALENIVNGMKKLEETP